MGGDKEFHFRHVNLKDLLDKQGWLSNKHLVIQVYNLKERSRMKI